MYNDIIILFGRDIEPKIRTVGTMEMTDLDEIQGAPKNIPPHFIYRVALKKTPTDNHPHKMARNCLDVGIIGLDLE